MAGPGLCHLPRPIPGFRPPPPHWSPPLTRGGGAPPSTDNSPTFEDDQSPARNHLLRLMTALFYVPFMVVSAIYVPTVIHIFMAIMVTKGLGEFIECLIPLRSAPPL